jgi:hypothetical protein
MRKLTQGIAAGLLGLLLVAAAAADDFRIETRLYIDDEKEPLSENITLFHAGQVYDFQSEPARITVFDPPRSRFILLDPQRKTKTEFPTIYPEQLAQKLRDWAAGHSDAFLKFQANPSFEERLDESPLVFSSPWMTYEVKADKAPNAEAARQYGEFSDWYARLNTMSNTTVLPFARLYVNAALRDRQLVPTEVRRTIVHRGEQVARTEHHVVWRLSTADLKRIDRTGEDLATFKSVPLDLFNGKRPDQAKAD